MSLSCEVVGDLDGADWWWYQPQDEAPLATKRSRKCCSCNERIAVGDVARKVPKYRPPRSDIEERIHGDEVRMRDMYLCEKCGDLADSISELGFCFSLGGESLQEQINEYRAAEKDGRGHGGDE